MNQEREQRNRDAADAPANAPANARRRGGPLSRALLGMSPLGDSVRSWGATLAAVGVYFALPTGTGPDGWIVFADTFYAVFLLLTWAAMLRSSPSDIRRWAVVQEVPGSRLRRILLVLASSRLFSGWAGLFTIVSVCFVGLVLGLSLVFQAREGYEARRVALPRNRRSRPAGLRPLPRRQTLWAPRSPSARPAANREATRPRPAPPAPPPRSKEV